jgi:hypothetical protein
LPLARELKSPAREFKSQTRELKSKTRELKSKTRELASPTRDLASQRVNSSHQCLIRINNMNPSEKSDACNDEFGDQPNGVATANTKGRLLPRIKRFAQ